LGHDQLDIFVFKTRRIDLLSIILIIVLLVITLIDSLTLSVIMGMIMARVVVSGVVVLLLSGELLGSGSLSLGIEILNFGLTENTIKDAINTCALRGVYGVSLHVGIAGGGLVDFRVVDDEKNLERDKKLASRSSMIISFSSSS
jgi:hypothetical protein